MLRITKCKKVNGEIYNLVQETDENNKPIKSWEHYPKDETIEQNIERLHPYNDTNSDAIRCMIYVDNTLETVNDNKESNYKSLSNALTSKYLNKSQYIKRIARKQKNSHKEIIVTYNNNVKVVYKVWAHF